MATIAKSVIQSGNTALITGAASGVGFAIASLLREKGMHLALLDIDRDNLAKAKSVLATINPSLKTESYVIDVADVTAWKETTSEIAKALPAIDLVVLNAGKGYKPQGKEGTLKQWLDGNYWRKTFETNTFGPLNGIEALLPQLISSGSSPKSIVITGSKQGITNPPGGGNPAYNASKAAIKNLAEHLAYDLRSSSASAHISVHLLVPGWTWTGMMGNVGPTKEDEVKKPAGAWWPSQVADELLRGLENGSFYIICPDDDTDYALDQARMKWAGDDVIENRPPLSRWDDGWKTRAAEAIEADAKARRSN